MENELDIRCRFCNRKAKNKNGNATHESRCNSNPEKRLPTEKWKAAMAARRGKGTNQHTKAKERGEVLTMSDETREKLRLANIGRKHSEETKQKISASRKAFLEANPHMVPYKLNHYSKGESYPETYFRNVLENANVSFVQELQVNLYSLDFAILDKKIDLEIDGEQHYVNSQSIERDKKRDDYMQSLGWQVIRVRWSEYKCLDENERKAFCQDLLNFIDNQEKKQLNQFEKFQIFKSIIKNPEENERKTTKGEARKKAYEETQKALIPDVLSSGIDFSSIGWVSKVSLIIGQPHSKVQKWMKRFMPTFYENECFKRKSKLSSENLGLNPRSSTTFV